MTYTEHTGAFRATWRKDNPRSLLETVIAKNPQDAPELIFKKFWQEIEDDRQLLQACVEYWFDNNYRSLVTVKPRTPQPRSAKLAVNEVSKKIQERVVDQARTMLLELIMPNDKKLGDCTGHECVTFGGWMALIGKKVPPSKIVSAVLSESDAWQIWQIAQKKHGK